jgi:signal transduction histidine kinase
MQYLKNLTIVSKFIVWFLIISLTPLTLAILISYNSSRKALKTEAASRLIAIADSKANQLEGYLSRLKKDGATVSYIPPVVEAVQKLVDGYHTYGPDAAEYNAIKQEFKPVLTYYQQSFGYDNILIINADGNPVFSTRGGENNRSLYDVAMRGDSDLANIFIKAKTSQETEMSNFTYFPQLKKTGMMVATPVYNAAGLLGVVIIQISNQGIYGFVKDYIGLGKTGETIIAAKKGNEAIFLTPCRFDPEAEFKRTVELGSRDGLDVQKAIQGEGGSGITLDYRNSKVLAVWRHLSAFNLGFVVKMDVQEVFASANGLRNTLLAMSLALVVAVIFAAVLVAYSISTPLKELTQISSVIALGDLSARAPVRAQDEIGQLAQSFNQMTASLIDAKDRVEQKKAEVEEQKRLLEEANKELDSFVYTVSHDLRAPLRGIDGFATFLEHDYVDKLDGQGKDYLARIRSGARRMKTLIDDLLTLSRISRIKNPYEDVPIGELVQSVLTRIEFDVKACNAQVLVADSLPVVRCDRIKMAEVFLNLVNNAIKFSSKNKEARPRVEIGYRDAQDRHEFHVKDNGIGIDKKYHQEIFGIFKRLHKQEEYEGTGAGLSIVKRIIDDHKGSIWTDSEPGCGATFYFTLPKVATQETGNA